MRRKFQNLKVKFIEYFMDIARRTAELSHARRLHVGAIVVKDDRIISIGYNGMPAGWDNNCEDEIKWPNGDIKFLTTKPEALHAETNAIAKLARSNESGLGGDMFITHSPCLDCAKLIYQAGIKRVWFGASYRDSSGVDFLKNSGVTVTQVQDD
jgi:dCMP deaminase